MCFTFERASLKRAFLVTLDTMSPDKRLRVAYIEINLGRYSVIMTGLVTNVIILKRCENWFSVATAAVYLMKSCLWCVWSGQISAVFFHVTEENCNERNAGKKFW